jgi:hypothetical protein
MSIYTESFYITKEKNMEEDIFKKIEEVLPLLNEVPSYASGDLFTDEICKLTKFQILCRENCVNRIVFSLKNTKSLSDKKDIVSFQTLYCRLNGSDAYLKREDSNPEKYPKFKNDYMNDLAPETIAKMLKIVFIENKDENNALPLFLLKLSDTIEVWSNYFHDKAKKLKEIKNKVDDIYDESL